METRKPDYKVEHAALPLGTRDHLLENGRVISLLVIANGEANKDIER